MNDRSIVAIVHCLQTIRKKGMASLVVWQSDAIWGERVVVCVGKEIRIRRNDTSKKGDSDGNDGSYGQTVCRRESKGSDGRTKGPAYEDVSPAGREETHSVQLPDLIFYLGI
jgi:hypothetical protein